MTSLKQVSSNDSSLGLNAITADRGALSPWLRPPPSVRWEGPRSGHMMVGDVPGDARTYLQRRLVPPTRTGPPASTPVTGEGSTSTLTDTDVMSPPLGLRRRERDRKNGAY